MVKRGDRCGTCIFYVHKSNRNIPEGDCHGWPPRGDRHEGGARPGVSRNDQACSLFDDGVVASNVEPPRGVENG